jgi:hypothetical protein
MGGAGQVKEFVFKTKKPVPNRLLICVNVERVVMTGTRNCFTSQVKGCADRVNDPILTKI